MRLNNILESRSTGKYLLKIPIDKVEYELNRWKIENKFDLIFTQKNSKKEDNSKNEIEFNVKLDMIGKNANWASVKLTLIKVGDNTRVSINYSTNSFTKHLIIGFAIVLILWQLYFLIYSIDDLGGQLKLKHLFPLASLVMIILIEKIGFYASGQDFGDRLTKCFVLIQNKYHKTRL